MSERHRQVVIVYDMEGIYDGFFGVLEFSCCGLHGFVYDLGCG